MSKKIVLIVSVLCVGFGFFILFFSLLLASPAYKIGETNHRVMRTFYFNDEVLPDHFLYPILNTGDLLVLKFAREQDKNMMRLDFAQERLNAAYKLHKKEPQMEELLLTTVEKSHVYLTDGLQEEINSVELKMVPVQVIYVAEILNRRRQIILEIGRAVSDGTRSNLDKVVHEEDLIRQKIWTKYGEYFRKMNSNDEVSVLWQ